MSLEALDVRDGVRRPLLRERGAMARRSRRLPAVPSRERRGSGNSPRNRAHQPTSGAPRHVTWRRAGRERLESSQDGRHAWLHCRLAPQTWHRCWPLGLLGRAPEWLDPSAGVRSGAVGRAPRDELRCARMRRGARAQRTRRPWGEAMGASPQDEGCRPTGRWSRATRLHRRRRTRSSSAARPPAPPRRRFPRSPTP